MGRRACGGCGRRRCPRLGAVPLFQSQFLQSVPSERVPQPSGAGRAGTGVHVQAVFDRVGAPGRGRHPRYHVQLRKRVVEKPVHHHPGRQPPETEHPERGEDPRQLEQYRLRQNRAGAWRGQVPALPFPAWLRRTHERPARREPRHPAPGARMERGRPYFLFIRTEPFGHGAPDGAGVPDSCQRRGVQTPADRPHRRCGRRGPAYFFQEHHAGSAFHDA